MLRNRYSQKLEFNVRNTVSRTYYEYFTKWLNAQKVNTENFHISYFNIATRKWECVLNNMKLSYVKTELKHLDVCNLVFTKSSATTSSEIFGNAFELNDIAYIDKYIISAMYKGQLALFKFDSLQIRRR